MIFTSFQWWGLALIVIQLVSGILAIIAGAHKTGVLAIGYGILNAVLYFMP